MAGPVVIFRSTVMFVLPENLSTHIYIHLHILYIWTFNIIMVSVSVASTCRVNVSRLHLRARRVNVYGERLRRVLIRQIMVMCIITASIQVASTCVLRRIMGHSFPRAPPTRSHAPKTQLWRVWQSPPSAATRRMLRS